MLLKHPCATSCENTCMFSLHVNNKDADQSAHSQIGIVICYHRILKMFFVQVQGEMQKIEGEAHLGKEMLLYTAGRSPLGAHLVQ